MDLGLKDAGVFIAGGSRGIGLAIARRFLTEGARVAISGRGQDDLNAAQDQLQREFGEGRIIALQGDMTAPADVATAIQKAVDAFGPLISVIANVGSGKSLPGWDIEAEEWRRVMDVNFVGSMVVARAALTHMTRNGAGSLTFVGSIAGKEPIAAPVTYSSAKAALQMAMSAFARDVAAQGVRVNAVAPGNIYFDGGTWDRLKREKPDFVTQYIETEVPMKRLGRPEDVADLVAFLSSGCAEFITGAVMVVDGGQSRSL